MNIYDFCIE